MINTHILYFTKYPVTSFYDVQSLLYYISVCSTRHSDIYIACVYIYGAFQHQLQDSGITFQSLPHSDRHSDVSAPSVWKITSAQSNLQTTGSSGQEKCLKGTSRWYLQTVWDQHFANLSQCRSCGEKATPARSPAKKPTPLSITNLADDADNSSCCS